MIKHILIFVFSLATLLTFSQSDKQFKRWIKELDTVQTMSSLQRIEQGLTGMVKEEKKLKQSLYYASLANLLMAIKSGTTEVDDYCRRADLYLKKLDSLSPNNSEIHVLLSMSAGIKIGVDPSTRQTKFGALANKHAERAIALNSNNPRAYLIKAKTVMNAPPKLGGGPKFALKFYEKSLEKFKSFKPLDDTEPDWGEAMAKTELADCKSKLAK